MIDDRNPLAEPDEPSEHSDEADDDDLAAARGSAANAAAAIASGDDPDSRDYFALRIYGLRSLRQRLSLATDVAADVVDEAMAKFVSAREERELLADTALAYFRRIVHNEAIDRLRRRHELPIGDLADEHDVDGDDAIARIIDKQASASTIEQLQKDAAQRGDTTTTRVLNAFMNLAESKKRTPTTREVAGAAQVSHRTVQNVLKKLREQLGSQTEDL